MDENPMGARRLSAFRVGDVVEVRSVSEILATLDERGELENLPFMPEMLKFCGTRLRVHKVAHKLCDTIGATGLHWMNAAVHLEGTRCDGAAHGGCQTGCQFYWKDAWLKRASSGDGAAVLEADAHAQPPPHVALLEANTRKPAGTDGEVRYACQATELMRAAPIRIRVRDPGPYLADVKTGNVGVLAMLQSLGFRLFNAYQGWSRKALPSWLRIRDGRVWRCVQGRAIGETPTIDLGLRAWDVVRIRTQEEIERTLNVDRKNRGMGIEEEAARWCGKTARVARRVDRCIDEKTGRMLTMRTPCLVLEGVVCEGVYNASCPREFIPFWREIWLERIPAARAMTSTDERAASK